MFFSIDHINNDKKNGKSRSYKIVFVPKKVSDISLEIDHYIE